MDRKQFDQSINHCRQKFLLIANNLATIRSLAAKGPLTISKDSPLAANFILSANNAFQGGSDQPFEAWRVRYTTRRQKSKVDSDRQQFDPWVQIGNSPIFKESLARIFGGGKKCAWCSPTIRSSSASVQSFLSPALRYVDPWRQKFILFANNSIIIRSPTIRSSNKKSIGLPTSQQFNPWPWNPCTQEKLHL